MHHPCFSRILPFLGLWLLAGPLPAQPDPAASRWRSEVGAGLMTAPAFKGSAEQQWRVVPVLRVAYGDVLFASYEEGVGYNLLRGDGWRAGPVVRYTFSRDEDGASAFRVAGEKSTALRGLGDVDGTAEFGAFARYRAGPFSARFELRQAFSGHEGFVADLGLGYTQRFTGPGGLPGLFTVGPGTTWVSARYNRTYFGVDAAQAAGSGLTVYRPAGGWLEYGVGALAVIPLTPRLSATLQARFDRLADEAAASPLVRLRGDRNQAMAAVFVTYRFGRAGRGF